MKVLLVVVQGKPEGKTIPLAVPKFKIGRGEGCQLRPNSDLVSREHAEFELGTDTVTVRDLGSRNGTDVNGKPLVKDQPYTLKNGDLVKVGSLTFAVSIEGVEAPKVAAPAGPTKKSLDDVSHDDIDAWLVSDGARPTPDRPSGVYGGDTITIETLKNKEKSSAKIPIAPVAPPAPVAKVVKPEPVPVAEPEPEPEVVDEVPQYSPDDEDDDGIHDLSKSEELEVPEEYVDESNPFYVKKKDAAPTEASKGPNKDSSDAAGDILRKMMDRRKASKS